MADPLCSTLLIDNPPDVSSIASIESSILDMVILYHRSMFNIQYKKFSLQFTEEKFYSFCANILLKKS